MFASLQRGGDNFPVEMRRRANDDGLDVFQFEKFIIIGEGLGLGREFLGAVEPGLVGVTDGDDGGVENFGVGFGQEGESLEDFAAADTATNHGARDGRSIGVVIGIHELGGIGLVLGLNGDATHGEHETADGGAPDKIAAVEISVRLRVVVLRHK